MCGRKLPEHVEGSSFARSSSSVVYLGMCNQIGYPAGNLSSVRLVDLYAIFISAGSSSIACMPHETGDISLTHAHAELQKECQNRNS